MLRIALSAIAVSLLALTINAGLALAQPARVFVAAQGLDSNPCTFALPCRTFQHAHDVVAANGEIDVLDPAGYGAVTITKSISIQGHGFAGISAPGAGATAIIISAGGTDKISLRGLLIDGVGTGDRGIKFLAGGSLDLQDCVIRNFVADGLGFFPSATSALFVSNSHLSDNGGGIIVGSAVVATGSASGALDHVVIKNNAGYGIFFGTPLASVKFSVSDSVISNNSAGVDVFGNGNPLDVTVRNTTISNNGGFGLQAAVAPTIVRVTKSTITGNAQGFAHGAGAQIITGADNFLNGNTADGAPTSTVTLQ